MSEHQQLQQYQIGHRTGNDPAEAAAASSSGYPTGYTGYDHNAAAMAASYQSHGHSNSQGSIDVPLTDYQSSLYASTMDHAIAGKGAANDFHGYMNPSMAMHSTGYQQDPYNTPAGAQSTTGYSLESQFLNSNNGASGTPTGEQSADYTQRLAFELPSPTNTSLMFPSQMLNQQ
ncbi:hypothetical protein BJ085DRAFT_33468 [Dimargaris cristalligena]|uniref:Uncharacterized protein n=1 Tax=Dimargaris cristalligena TaxID=215637 RepID=A0A4P9ZZV2_9FUNG|nr:hypothetical protein BJ085DRAFT_33468 [Dimargaris cristalligena]|eukprot:RKP39247.1 hypothetical protein BJ085DRAFT_33468 [Dimargaris cristalligena]